jgi:carbamoyltransferase
MYVLGISSGLKAGHHDGGAVLMRDGEIVAAAEEERFTLAKHARGELPRGAIRFCLAQAGVGIAEVDYVCSPLKTYPRYAERLREYFVFQFGSSPKIELYDHHTCHAASAYYASGFERATVLSLDNSGDSSSGGVFRADRGRLERVADFGRHNSLGLFYGMMTQYLGFQMTHDEYKVMGLASYGRPRFLAELESVLRADGLQFWFDPDLDKRLRDRELYSTDFSTRQERIFTDRLEVLLGPRRLPGAPLDERHRDIAASAQRQLERVVLSIVREATARTGHRDVCMAGGVALNCRANMEVWLSGDITRLYVPPVPHDAGVALGAAMLKVVEHGFAIAPVRHACFGPGYAPAQIRRVLEQTGAAYSEPPDLCAAAAHDLVEQRTVGWFQGRMEFGPRALGNRSILADPRRRAMKDHINATIKYREQFRPFCPSVLYEAQNRYFRDGFDAPFMNVTFPVCEGAEENVPAVIHVDGTARIQSVRRDTSPLYHELIERFCAAGGPPLLLNTSLNINEQPMVNGPLEALHTYFCSGLDVLYLGPFRLAKPRIEGSQVHATRAARRLELTNG